jgi:hypothetical protein
MPELVQAVALPRLVYFSRIRGATSGEPGLAELSRLVAMCLKLCSFYRFFCSFACRVAACSAGYGAGMGVHAHFVIYNAPLIFNPEFLY